MSTRQSTITVLLFTVCAHAQSGGYSGGGYSGQNSRLSGGSIAGIIVGAIIFCLLLCLCCMTSMRRPRAGAEIPISTNHRRFGGGGSSVDLGVQEAGYAGPPQPPWNNTQAASDGYGGYQPPGQPPAPPPPYSREGGEFTPEVREFAPPPGPPPPAHTKF
ncbi:hypothetical protein SCP_0906100 [Sparassis crispa]|uniref:Uncharacterized protein n=1 Tax=Sparassis crispa TaxID=139825 RepID=A0A401GX19_9APHY|nr:hypothetical protein SCP_0906100 [Sparassis crispa]GBE86730.1 hypothetical protein SCP_0906100 [Sparassis crispa]